MVAILAEAEDAQAPGRTTPRGHRLTDERRAAKDGRPFGAKHQEARGLPSLRIEESQQPGLVPVGMVEDEAERSRREASTLGRAAASTGKGVACHTPPAVIRRGSSVSG
jgi:hypothetical protein